MVLETIKKIKFNGLSNGSTIIPSAMESIDLGDTFETISLSILATYPALTIAHYVLISPR